MSENNVFNTISNFIVQIPRALIDQELLTNKDIPLSGVDQFSLLCDWYKRRVEYTDAYMEALA